MTFKNHIFIGKKVIPPLSLSSDPLLTHTLFLSLVGVLTYFKVWFRSLPGSRLEEAPEITWCPFWLSEGVQPHSMGRHPCQGYSLISGWPYSTLPSLTEYILVHRQGLETICSLLCILHRSWRDRVPCLQLHLFLQQPPLAYIKSIVNSNPQHSPSNTCFQVKWRPPVWSWRIASAEPQDRTGSWLRMNFIWINTAHGGISFVSPHHVGRWSAQESFSFMEKWSWTHSPYLYPPSFYFKEGLCAYLLLLQNPAKIATFAFLSI